MSPKQPIHPITDEFREEYLALIAPAIPYIIDKINSGVKPRRAVERAFSKFNILDSIDTITLDKVVDAAAKAYNVDTPAKPRAIRSYFNNNFNISNQIYNSDIEKVVENEVVKAFRKGKNYRQIAVGLEGKSLIRADIPKYIDRVISATRGAVDGKTLQKEVIRAARKLERLSLGGAPNQSLKAAYSDLVRKANTASTLSFEKSVEIALQEKARYNAERIARTEIARANGVSMDLKALNDPDVVGVKYSLSSRHNIYDICDFHTSANLYDMGPGVYPKERHPSYPFHPHCTCVRSSVFVGEAEKGRYNPSKGESWIKSRSAGEQKQLLGKKGRERFRKSGRWQNHLRNWNGHDDITKPKLTESMFI
jgi:hypothetical protein